MIIPHFTIYIAEELLEIGRSSIFKIYIIFSKAILGQRPPTIAE